MAPAAYLAYRESPSPAMTHSIPLISTIAISLAYALAGGYLANRLRLPPLVGYLVAGIAVGPFTPGFVADVHLAPQLAEIGVILLMFGVGMHFSWRDLLTVWRIAVPGALLQILGALGLSLFVTHYWGWNWGPGVLFGLAISVASTVVLLRALASHGIVDSEAGRIAIGWLIVEDLVMVLVLVAAPALAGSTDGAAAPNADLALAMALTLGKVAAFVAVMLLLGPRVLPWLLKEAERTGSRELFTLAVIAIALGVAFGAAELFGVSFALGAFFAGVLVNASDLSRRAADELRPLQDAFGALFFVSVGMLFNPTILAQEPLRVLAVVAIIVLGKSCVAYGLVRAFGYANPIALTVCVGLAQIGEFSFILVSLGTELHLLSAAARDLILAGALISITLNPLLFRLIARSFKPPREASEPFR